MSSNDFAAGQDSSQSAPPLHYQGYQVTTLADSGKVVAVLNTLFGRQDQQLLAIADDPTRLSRHRAKQLAEAIAHAVNSGMTVEELRQITEQFAELVERNNFAYSTDVIPMGLVIDQPTHLRYIFGPESVEVCHELLVIRPQISTDILSVLEFMETCNAY